MNIKFHFYIKLVEEVYIIYTAYKNTQIQLIVLIDI